MSDRLVRFQSLPEAEGRVLLLINAFSGTVERPRELEGRLKLAKLDFLVRYPKYLVRVLRDRDVSERAVASIVVEPTPLQDQMIRYRYGPWDPSYFAVLGSLIGRGLVEPVPTKGGIGYRASAQGRGLAGLLAEDETWSPIQGRALAARRYLDLSGSKLKELLYQAIPEMTNADWHSAVE